jgi:hypothetical protein
MLIRVAAAVLIASHAFAQEAPALHGTWSATVGPTRAYRGSWSAQVARDRSNAVRGAWVLVNDLNQKVMEGTWSAEKSPSGWQGSWSARALTRPSSLGPPVSGTWRAAIDDASSATLIEMLQQTVKKQIAGSWRSGQLTGNWSLRGVQ